MQYTRNNDFVQPTQDTTSSVRAVARKSTTRPQGSNNPPPHIVPFLPTINNHINTTGPTSKIMVRFYDNSLNYLIILFW